MKVSTVRVLCFGSEGCLLVPRSSSTSVVAWTWLTWVVSWRRVLEAVFVLLESQSHSRRIFIGFHSLPPSLVRRIGHSEDGAYCCDSWAVALLPTLLSVLGLTSSQAANRPSANALADELREPSAGFFLLAIRRNGSGGDDARGEGGRS
jgi:hypothetical protein